MSALQLRPLTAIGAVARDDVLAEIQMIIPKNGAALVRLAVSRRKQSGDAEERARNDAGLVPPLLNEYPRWPCADYTPLLGALISELRDPRPNICSRKGGQAVALNRQQRASAAVARSARGDGL